MTERDRSRIVWFTLLALVVLMLWVVSRSYSAEISKGGQSQIQGAKWSRTLSEIMPKYTLVVPPATMNVTLAWDRSPSTNILTNYTLWWGRASSNYNTFTNAQTHYP